jgi:hypothetical protein
LGANWVNPTFYEARAQRAGISVTPEMRSIIASTSARRTFIALRGRFARDFHSF